ncbi:RICIN domain-containing protein [Crossiella sp. CA198]|uniref:RICIN domain-containing protein n=1 Tax=Crossiella sp. CA198 TaxID=3455607 RepID=UPI003F8D1F76
MTGLLTISAVAVITLTANPAPTAGSSIPMGDQRPLKNVQNQQCATVTTDAIGSFLALQACDAHNTAQQFLPISITVSPERHFAIYHWASRKCVTTDSEIVTLTECAYGSTQLWQERPVESPSGAFELAHAESRKVLEPITANVREGDRLRLGASRTSPSQLWRTTP